MMHEIEVLAHGVGFEHPASFAVDRPFGLGCFLLLHFYSPMEVRLTSGLTRAEAGQCILFSPGHTQWYRGREGDWSNDWMHIYAESEVLELLAARHQVALNTLLTPRDTHFLSPLFEKIASEQRQAETGWQETIELLVRQILLLLGRALAGPALTAAEAEHLQTLRALRWRVHKHLTRHWTVSGMAAEVGLSCSRFAALYQQFFGVSPIEDLLRARLQHAERLLTNRAMPIAEAAKQSGFSSAHYFSHIFRQRVGCAPRDYHRRSGLWGSSLGETAGKREIEAPIIEPEKPIKSCGQ